METDRALSVEGTATPVAVATAQVTILAIKSMVDKTRYYTDIKMDAYTACSIAEGFDGEEHTEDELHDAWQYIVDTGLWLSLQGWYGRNAHALIDAGTILPPDKDQVDSYRNKVKAA
jgi:hypothetical protein